LLAAAALSGPAARARTRRTARPAAATRDRSMQKGSAAGGWSLDAGALLSRERGASAPRAAPLGLAIELDDDME